MRKHRIGTLAIAVSFVIAALTTSPSVRATNAYEPLYPDLVMLQPDDFHLERKPRGVRWLRFSTTIANMGPGVFDVYGDEPSGSITSSSTLAVTQQLLDSSGTTQETIQTPATMFYAGDGHAHWHILDLQHWMLSFEATPNEAVASGAKRGFCFWDNVDLLREPTNYGNDQCLLSATDTVPMGLSVGWGDEYPWHLAYQYIDVSRLPYGNYCLSLTADPNNEFVEANNDNNTVRTRISIKSGRVSVIAQDCP